MYQNYCFVAQKTIEIFLFLKKNEKKREKKRKTFSVRLDTLAVSVSNTIKAERRGKSNV
jgi:hypothetical protein